MRYLPLAERDRSEMLRSIGASSVDDLFVDVPQAARLTGTIKGLADHASELSVERQMNALARRNLVAGEVPFFLGAGAYRHHIPASVDQLKSSALQDPYSRELLAASGDLVRAQTIPS